MRVFLLAALVVVGLGCNTPKNSMMKQGELNGTWEPIRQEIAGRSLPTAAFEKQKLIITDNQYTMIAESVDKGEVKFGKGKMDIYGKDGVNAGKHFTAIYKYEKGELTICYDLSGDAYPEGFETKSRPTLFLSTFKRERKS